MVGIYAFFGLAFAIGASLGYFVSGEPSLGSKILVGAVVALSVLIWWRYPQWSVIGTVLQAGVGIYVLIYFRVTSHV